MNEEDWLSEEEQKEIDAHEIRKFNREKAWKDNQLNRIEETINRTQKAVSSIAFFGFIFLLVIFFQVY